MATNYILQTNFNGGEISSLMNKRTDYPAYFNSAITLENFICLPQGPIFRRKGFKFIKEVKDSSKETRLLSFDAGESDSYAMEFGEEYIRFYRNGEALAESTEVETPYQEDELFNIKVVQDADVMYIIHPNHPPQRLTRLTATNFEIEEVEFIRGPLRDENLVTSHRLKVNGSDYSVGGELTMTATGHTPFTENHIGSIWRIKLNNDETYIKVTDYTDTANVTVEVLYESVPSSLRNVNSNTWSEGEFSNHRGYPSAIALHEQRLLLASTEEEPQRIWFSASNNDYTNFERGLEADDPFTIAIATQKVDRIRWLFSDDILFIGTISGIFRASNSSEQSTLSAVNLPNIKKNISYGCSPIQPELIGDFPVFLQKGNDIVRAISFSVEADRYKAPDITIVAEHIIRGGVKEIDYQQDPINSLWLVKNNGELARLTSIEEQKILAWSRYTTDGEFESITINSTADENDLIYTIVKRGEKRFVEYQRPNYDVNDESRFYVDSGITYDGDATTTIDGLDHLEGKEVQVNFDGATGVSKTVSNGEIELDSEGSLVHIGLGYDSTYKSLPIENKSQHKKTRVDRLFISFQDTLGGNVEVGDYTIPVLARSLNDDMGEVPPLTEGDEELILGSTWGITQVTIEQQEPQPMTIKSISYKLTVNSS